MGHDSPPLIEINIKHTFKAKKNMDTYSNTLPKGSILQGKSYNYCIEKVLGQGSFGITYMASVKMQGALGSIDANVKVAIKEFFMKEINGREGSTVTSGSKGGLFADYRRMFVREALNLSKLQHPNIIRILENFDGNGTSYYVMEYVDGDNLNKFIADSRRLSEKEALTYVLETAKAIDFMHHNHMLHLDVKPLNIMRRNNGDVVLIDFGLSKQFNDEGEPESSTRIGGGTIGYAPIEQHTYRKGNGFPATLDIYALGATLYKCLTGQTPPEASIVLNEGLPVQILQAYGISSKIIELTEKAMEPIVRRRIQSAAELISEIRSLLPEAQTTCDDTDEQTVYDDDCGEGMVGIETSIPWHDNMNDAMKEAIRQFISDMIPCKSGCKVGNVSFEFYNSIMQGGTVFYGLATLGVSDILQFIDHLQRLTGQHWRLPNLEELIESFDSRSGIPGPKMLYYDADNVSLCEYKKFSGERGAISHHDYFSGQFECLVVLDPLQAEWYQTADSYKRMNIHSTRCIVDQIGLWHFGLRAMRLGDKWGIIDKYETTVLDYQFDAEPVIGFMSYPSAGPLPMDRLRIKYQKGSKVGYYLVLPNNNLQPEIECDEEEWRQREAWS